MLFATFDLEILDDPDFLALEAHNPAWTWWWMRIIQAAKRYNRKGFVCRSDGRPIRARDLAVIHHRNPLREQDWAEMLDACVALGLIEDEDGLYRVTDWRRWHRSPSDEPERVRERVAKHRANKKNPENTGANQTLPLQPLRNGCNGTEQSRAEHSRAETEQKPPPPSSSFSNPETDNRDEKDRQAGGFERVGEDDFLPTEHHDPLEPVRSTAAQMMQSLGYHGTLQGRYLSALANWARPALERGISTRAVTEALQWGVDATAWQQVQGNSIRNRWTYANAIAAEQLEAAHQFDTLRKTAAERGLPTPKPFRFTPPKPKEATT